MSAKKSLLFASAILLISACAPALSSIIVSLEDNKIYLKEDGYGAIIINNRGSIMRNNDPKAKYPRGRGTIESNTLSPDEFKYYLNEHKRLKSYWNNFDYSTLKFGYSCWLGYEKGEIQDKFKCEEALAINMCNSTHPESINIKNYPVDGKKSAWVSGSFLKPADGNKPASCKTSKLRYGCKSGGCWGVVSSGEYGFFPGKWNTISIDGRNGDLKADFLVNKNMKYGM